MACCDGKDCGIDVLVPISIMDVGSDSYSKEKWKEDQERRKCYMSCYRSYDESVNKEYKRLVRGKLVDRGVKFIDMVEVGRNRDKGYLENVENVWNRIFSYACQGIDKNPSNCTIEQLKSTGMYENFKSALHPSSHSRNAYEKFGNKLLNSLSEISNAQCQDECCNGSSCIFSELNVGTKNCIKSCKVRKIKLQLEKYKELNKSLAYHTKDLYKISDKQLEECQRQFCGT